MISFAAVVGVGWIVVLGEWLRQAGPVGAMLAFVAAGGIMMLVGLCYAEVCTSIPAAGGEMAYAFAAFGPIASYAVGWFLALVYVSAAAFEGLSVGWLSGILFPVMAGRELYEVHGTPVTSGTLVLGLGGTAWLTVLNYRGIRSSGRSQGVLTAVKVGISVVLVSGGLIWGNTDNLRPWFASADGSIRDRVYGTLTVFVSAPFWLAGFNTVAQLMEEKAPSASYASIVKALLASIAAASLFYALLILSSSMGMPWEQIPRLEFPAIGAFAAALHSPLAARIVLLGGLVGLLATWNAVFIAASRVLYALGRAGMIHPQFARVHARFHAPTVAVVVVGFLSGAGILLGRSVLLPIINMDSGCFMLMYALVAISVLRLRQLEPERVRPYRVPGGRATLGIAAVASLLMFGEAAYLPLHAAPGRAPVEWMIFLGWAALGALGWGVAARSRGAMGANEQRVRIMGTTG
jgi:amino acid transporter